MKQRTFAKYPSCFGKLRIGQLVKVARRHGMEVLCASKPGMHVYNEIGLYGTTEQMRAVEAEWTAAGNEPKPRSFRAVSDVPLNLPRKHWLDVPTDHRDWCKDRMAQYGRECECDFEPATREEIGSKGKETVGVVSLDAENKG